MNKKHCLSILLLMILIIVIVVYCLNFTEGFEKEEAIPDYCGSAGYAPSQAILNIFGMKMKDVGRGYTQSECDKIEDAKFKDGECTLTKNGKEINCNETCKGLNTIPSLPPDECKIDEKIAGITNKEFKIKFGNKKLDIPENSVRLYTEKECDKLNGKHDIAFLTQMSKTEREEFIKNHGKGYGFCGDNELKLSLICYAEPPSMTDIKNSILSNF